MMVRIYWRNCSLTTKSQDLVQVDAFWVEATHHEANSCIFPFLLPEQIEKSKRLALQFENVALDMGNPEHLFCFLVARDLSFIEPMEPHYPIHQLWNGYSPFESMPTEIIDCLESLGTMPLPTEN